MRFAIAIAVLVLSGVALILGIGQRTFLAPPNELVYSASERIDEHYAVISADAFTGGNGEPFVDVHAEGAFIAVGSQIDVEAWVSAFDHSVLTVDAESKNLTVTRVSADDTYAVDLAEDETLIPLGSDLWTHERKVSDPVEGSDLPPETHLRIPAEFEPHEAVLVASDSVVGLGTGVSVAWAQDRQTPWAGPLLVLSGVLALVGGVLYLLAIEHDRRGLGPRRGQSGFLPGIRGSVERRRRSRQVRRVSRTNRVALPAAVIVTSLAITGCSPTYWPDFSEPEIPETPVIEDDQPPAAPSLPITEEQLDEILDDVVAVAHEADETLNASLLESRFTGEALRQRSASYTIRAAVADYEMVPPILTDEQLGYDLVQTTQTWPRTVFVAIASGSEPVTDEGELTEDAKPEPVEEQGDTESDAGESAELRAEEAETPEPTPSLALILTQATPHENYRVTNIMTLRGGISMPEAAPASEGTALLSPETQTLLLAPGEVGEAFAATLLGELEEETAELFDLDGVALIERSGIAWVSGSQERADAEGFEVQYSVNVEVRENSITSLSVSDGGALVAVTVVEERISDTAGSTTRVRADGAISALSGLTGQQERITSEVAHQLLFFVPSKVSGETIQLLGATSELVGAGN